MLLFEHFVRMVMYLLFFQIHKYNFAVCITKITFYSTITSPRYAQRHSTGNNTIIIFLILQIHEYLKLYKQEIVISEIPC